MKFNFSVEEILINGGTKWTDFYGTCVKTHFQMRLRYNDLYIASSGKKKLLTVQKKKTKQKPTTTNLSSKACLQPEQLEFLKCVF